MAESAVRSTGRGFGAGRLTDARYVIDCNDTAVGPTDEQIRTTARPWRATYPIFGAHDAFHLFVCKTWQPQRAVLEPPVAPTPNRLLVVGTIHDSATPYVGAVALTKVLGNATLLTWEGRNHTATAYSTCIADAAARYLIDLTAASRREPAVRRLRAVRPRRPVPHWAGSRRARSASCCSGRSAASPA